MTRFAALPLLASAVFAAACARAPTVASRSHAAYQEALARGETVAGGHEHGMHASPHPEDRTESAERAGRPAR